MKSHIRLYSGGYGFSWAIDACWQPMVLHLLAKLTPAEYACATLPTAII